MNSPLRTARLEVSFKIDKDRTLDVMEAVLAIARRGGLLLAALQLRSRDTHDRAFLALAAPDADLLELFMTRLHNVFGIDDIERAG